MKKLFFMLLISLLCSLLLAEFSLQHTLFGRLDSEVEYLVDYKPNLQYDWQISSQYFVDFDYVHDFQGSGDFTENQFSEEIYRAWVRLAGDYFSARLGRQKINFGPARYLRTLRWFDTINPLDPRGESAGVDALLLRYYFLDNQNIWFWLVRNKAAELKGNEQLASTANIEPGVRWQIPLGSAEIAVSAHHRLRLDQQRETKIGGDFRFDYFLGFWGEYQYLLAGETSHQQISLGTDYTLPLFYGWHLMLEQQIFDQSELANLTAFSLDFPLSLFANFTLAYLTDSAGERQNLSLQYQRSYNQILWFLSFSSQKLNSTFENIISFNLSYDF